NDLNHLKPCLAQYCAPNPHDPSSLQSPIIISKDRSGLGLNHLILAWWLCPAHMLHVYDENPEQAHQDLASGKIEMKYHDFPLLFWSGTLPENDFQPKRMLHGPFRSYFIVQISCPPYFFGSVIRSGNHQEKKRSCNADLNGVTTIEPKHISYICVLFCFAISSKESWSTSNGNLNYLAMYNCIINFIKSSPTSWREDLLRWWNK
ncbi:hypothetical protein V8E55_010014, partial [Tylopilus felleus]